MSIEAVAEDLKPQKHSYGGRPTSETITLICQCGNYRFAPHKVTRSAVVFECKSCGVRTSVKGWAVVARVAVDELSYAVEHTLMSPQAKEEEEEGAKENKEEAGEREQTLLEQGYVTLRARFTKEQMAGVRRAMEAVRLSNANDSNLQTKSWHARALELICADFLAGQPPLVIELLDAQEEAVSREREIAERERGQPLTRNQETTIRRKIREKIADQLELGRKPSIYPKPVQMEIDVLREAAKDIDAMKTEADPDGRIIDDGFLFGLLSEDIRRNHDEKASANVGEISMLVGGAEDLPRFWKHAENAAKGFVVQVLGDPRTRTKNGLRPSFMAWVAEELFEENWCEAYSQELAMVLPDAKLEVIEFVPPPFTFRDGDELWDAPSFVTGREVYRG